jgi:hypothetical protein
MRQAYLVFGCEGSGTRLLTRILIAAGARGDHGHGQKFDDGLPTAADSDPTIVWRRSWPHARKTPDTTAMVQQLRDAGWSPYAFVIVRDTVPNVRAQVPAHAADIAAAWQKNQEMFATMFAGLYSEQVPYEVLTYEGLIARPYDVQDYLGYLPGLRTPTPYVEVKDANEKHWTAWRADHPRPVE